MASAYVGGVGASHKIAPQTGYCETCAVEPAVRSKGIRRPEGVQEQSMTNTIRIAGHSIGRSHRPFIIAEMSGNHNQSLDRALAIVDAAAKAGAHALKLQTYTADTMTLDLDRDEFFIDDPNSLWKGRSLHNLYQEAYTPW